MKPAVIVVNGIPIEQLPSEELVSLRRMIGKAATEALQSWVNENWNDLVPRAVQWMKEQEQETAAETSGVNAPLMG